MLTIPNEIVPLQIARGALRVPSAALAGLRAVLCAIPDIKGITMVFAPPALSVVPGASIVHEPGESDRRQIEEGIGRGPPVLGGGEEGAVAGEGVLRERPGPDPQTEIELGESARIHTPGIHDPHPRGVEHDAPLGVASQRLDRVTNFLD